MLDHFTVANSHFANYRPLGVVPQKAVGKFCLIHHLSYPHGESVNDAIPADLCTVMPPLQWAPTRPNKQWFFFFVADGDHHLKSATWTLDGVGSSSLFQADWPCSGWNGHEILSLGACCFFFYSSQHRAQISCRCFPLGNITAHWSLKWEMGVN